MKVSNEFVLREIAGEYLLVPVGSAVSGFHGLITLNETGNLLFSALYQESTADDLISLLTAEYDVDEQTARADVLEFLQQLRDVGALMENEP